MTTRAALGVTLIAIVIVALSSAQEGENTIQRSQLPPAVQKTVEQQSTGATVRGFSKERENGKTLYEVELDVNGHSKDILMDSRGVIAEVEEEVAFDSLPATVKSGLQAKAGRGKILKVESITKRDQLMAYEAKVVTDGKKSEIPVGPNGQSLAHEE